MLQKVAFTSASAFEEPKFAGQPKMNLDLK